MDNLRIVAPNKFGGVNTNLFAYHYLPDGKERNDQILIVDCGIGFPGAEDLGVDVMVPDVTYLKKRANKIVGMVLSHGHEDHVGALPYVLPEIKAEFPIFGAKFTAALSNSILEEANINKRVEEFKSDQRLTFGKFSVQFARVNHAIPDTFHLFIQTPVGNYYHGTDFKLDPTLGGDQSSELDKISEFGKRGVNVLVSDCLGIEHPGFSPSEQELNRVFEEEVRTAKGRVFITAISSSIGRWQKTINAATKFGRKISPVGYSVIKKTEIARKTGYLDLKKSDLVEYHKALDMPDDKIAFLIAGSQGQTGSSLDRVAIGKHQIKIKKGDKFIFSSPDYVPGSRVYALIDNLFKQGAEVAYEELGKELHFSGHGYRKEYVLLAKLIQPKYFIPIGGDPRHLYLYRQVMERIGFDPKRVLIPEGGKMPEFSQDGKVNFDYKLKARKILIDGLGIGDVGRTVLRDRRNLAEDGIIVLILLVNSENHQLVDKPTVASRGFVYLKQSKQLLGQIEKKAGKIYNQARKPTFDYQTIRQEVQGELEEFVKSKTGREPIILPVILEV